MDNCICFKAPWGTSLKVVTGISLVILGWVAFAGLTIQRAPSWVAVLQVMLPLSLVAGCAPFVIRSYEVSGGELRVRRLGWTARFALKGLKSAINAPPDALRGSLRVCGNGGLFVFAGWFWSKRLGWYRLLATNPRRCVILSFENRRVVVSPEPAEAFVHRIKEQAGLA